MTATFFCGDGQYGNTRWGISTSKKRNLHQPSAHESILGEFSQPLFPQTCAINLGKCIDSLVLTKLNKQRTLSGEHWGKPEQDPSDPIWVKVNNGDSLPWLWLKPETVATWTSQKDLTQNHFLAESWNCIKCALYLCTSSFMFSVISQAAF